MAEDKETTLEGVQTQVLGAIKTASDNWKAHYEELKAQGCDTDKRLEDVKKLTENAVNRLEEAEKILNRPDFAKSSASGEYKSVGQLVTEHEQVRKNFGEGKAVNWGGRLQIPIMNMNGGAAGSFFPERFGISMALAPEIKTTITSSTVGSSTPGILVPQRVPGIVKPPLPAIRVRELIPRFPTTSNAIEFVKEDTFTNLASPQTEASDKEESALTFTIDYETVKTIAHWIPATRQILDDFAQLGAYIDQRLLDGLADEEDDQILRGDGNGQNLSGLATEATAYSDATYDQTGDTALDKLVRMQTQLAASNYRATGYIMHPTNWWNVSTIKADYGGGTGTGPYVLGGPGGMAGAYVWGLPVATTTRMTSGQVFCGDFARYTALWDRMQARVDVSSEHSDYFIKNMVAVRAEERLALTTYAGGAVIYESSI